MSIADLAPPQAMSSGLFTGLIVGFFGHLWGYVPGAVAVTGGVLAIVWYCLMIWESATLRDWRTARSARKKLRKIAYLRAEESIISAELAELAPTPMVQAAETLAATPQQKAPVREVVAEPPSGAPPAELLPGAAPVGDTDGDAS